MTDAVTMRMVIPFFSVWEPKILSLGTQDSQFGKPRFSVWETKILSLGNQENSIHEHWLASDSLVAIR
jgi:hypothetical protein